MTVQAPFQEGEVLADKYRIARVLGTGGMGMVFAADHLDLGRRVALKVMQPGVCGNDEAIARLFREARAAARLNSPHVAKVLDVGRLDSGVPYLVMELLEGRNLEQLMAEHGALSVNDAVDYVLEACEALAEAHRAGIVHRDLKPANLFLTTDAYGEPLIKLLDFGISKVLSPDVSGDVGLTSTRTLLGSPVYMSPEQMRSPSDVDHRTDIWALGAIVFELVTGRVAWSGQSLSDICAQVARDPAPSLRSVLPGAPIELDAIVARCLQKNPTRRYQRVSDLGLALSPLGSARARVTLERILRMSGHDDGQTATTGIGLLVPAESLPTDGTESSATRVAAEPDAGEAQTPLPLALLPSLGTPAAKREAQTRGTLQGTSATGRAGPPRGRGGWALILLSVAALLAAALWLASRRPTRSSVSIADQGSSAARSVSSSARPEEQPVVTPVPGNRLDAPASGASSPRPVPSHSPSGAGGPSGPVARARQGTSKAHASEHSRGSSAARAAALPGAAPTPPDPMSIRR